MPVRTAYDPTAGEILTATNLEKLAGGWIGYAEVVVSQSAITARADLAGLSVPVTVGPARRIKVTGSIMSRSTVAADTMAMYTVANGVTIQGAAAIASVAGLDVTVERSVTHTPAAGVVTYKLQLERAGGTGTLTMSATANFIACITVEDLGPAV